MTTKADLFDQVDQYAHRVIDVALKESFLTDAQNRIAKDLRALEMRLNTLINDTRRPDPSTGAYTLPDDFIEARYLYSRGNPYYPIQAASGQGFIDAIGQSGAPRVYAIIGMELNIQPIPKEGSVFGLEYYARPPDLVDDTDTHPLLGSAPDLYRYAMLREYYTWARNAEMFSQADQKYLNLVNEINTADERRRYGQAPAVATDSPYGLHSSNGGM